MDLSTFLPTVLNGAGHWIVQVFIVVFISLIIDFIQKKVLVRIRKKLEKMHRRWEGAIAKSLQRPLSVLIWIVGISFAAQIIEKETQAAIFSAIAPIRSVGIIAIFSWFLMRLITNAGENVRHSFEQKGKSYDTTTADAVSKIFKAAIIITAGLVTLQTLGFSVSGVMAFGGIGGIAIGFAAKDLLANFFGAFMIFWDRPFKVGDWIRSPDRSIEGTVEYIGWRLTRIRTFAKRPLYVPNATFATITVENPSRMTHRRINETIGVRYDDAPCMPKLLQDIREMLRTHPEIDESQTLMVNLVTFGPSSLDFFIYTFTHTTVWTKFHEIKEEIMFKIYDIITDHGAEVAFPTSTVHLPSQSIDTLKVNLTETSSAPTKPGLPPKDAIILNKKTQ